MLNVASKSTVGFAFPTTIGFGCHMHHYTSLTTMPCYTDSHIFNKTKCRGIIDMHVLGCLDHL